MSIPVLEFPVPLDAALQDLKLTALLAKAPVPYVEQALKQVQSSIDVAVFNELGDRDGHGVVPLYRCCERSWMSC